jgi:hypothetical protein
VIIPTITKFLKTNGTLLPALINLILIGSYSSLSYSQDLYSKENSKKYAEYLSSSQQHILAAEEYERLVYFDTTNVSFKYMLVREYRLSGDLNAGIKHVYSYYGNSLDSMPQLLGTEFVRLQLLTDSLSVAQKYILHKNKLSSGSKLVFQSCGLLLSGDYSGANILAKDAAVRNPDFPSRMLTLTDKAAKIKFKSPFVAAGFSAIIPGTGKFYTKNWTDGIFAMLFVGGNAWQAYRGFHEHGVKSGYGWAFASLSASFYIGNIFGAAKAAKRYNKNKRNEIDNQVFEIVRSDNF